MNALRNLRILTDYFIWLLAVIVTLSGASLVIEQAADEIYSSKLIILGPWYIPVANYLAVISLFIVGVNTYLERFDRAKPTWIGKILLAPGAIAISLILLTVLIHTGHLSEKYLQGVSFLALGGALFRLRGLPVEAFRA